MIDITRLNFHGELVGYRISIGGKRYDVEVETMQRIGVSLDGVERTIELQQVGNLLMSKVEREHGKLATDLSDKPSKLQEVLEVLTAQNDDPNVYQLPTESNN